MGARLLPGDDTEVASDGNWDAIADVAIEYAYQARMAGDRHSGLGRVEASNEEVGHLQVRQALELLSKGLDEGVDDRCLPLGGLGGHEITLDQSCVELDALNDGGRCHNHAGLDRDSLDMVVGVGGVET